MDRAKAHLKAKHIPLLLAPERVEQRLYAYPPHDDAQGYMLTLGPHEWHEGDAPPPISWREFFRRKGLAMNRLSDFRRIRDKWEVLPRELDEPMDELTWITH